MEREKFIKQQIEMLFDDFSKSQIQDNVYRFVIDECSKILKLDALVYACMSLYADIMVEFNRIQYEVQPKKPNR